MFLFIFCHFSTLKITNWAYVTSNGMSYLQEPELKEQYVISKLRKIRRFAFVSSGRFELYFEQWKDLEGTSFFLSSSPTLHGAVCVYTQNLFIQIKPRFAAVRVGNEMYQRHLTTVSKSNVSIFLHAPAPIWCVTFPPWRAHHAYYCLLFWETPHHESEMPGFHRTSVPTRASHTAAVTAKADPLHERGKKKTCSLLPLDYTTPVLSPRRQRPTSKCQLSQELSPLFPQRKMSDGWWFSALWFHRSGDRTVCESVSQFDKWGIIMKMAFWERKVKAHFSCGRSAETAKDNV